MLTSKQMGIKIGGIRKSSEAIRNNVHEVLCNAAGYVLKDGDATFFTRLLSATSGINQTRIKGWIRENGLVTWNKQKNQYTVNKNARKEKAEEFADVHDFCMYLFTEASAWYIDPPKDDNDKDKKEFDVKAWAARQYGSHKDHLDAMIKELAKYKEKAKLDLVA